MKSLFSDPEAEQPQAPEGGGGDDQTPPEETTATVQRACPHCGAALADDQDWCLECGQGTRERRSGLPGWRTAATVIAVTLVMASGAVAAAYAALRSGDDDGATATTQVAQGPNADQIPPPPPIDIPPETAAERKAAEQAASAQAPPAVEPPAAAPPVSTPPPVVSSPPPVVSSPPPVTSAPPPVTSVPPSSPGGGSGGGSGSGEGAAKTEKKTKPVQRAPLTPVKLDPATTVAAAYNPFAHDPSTFSGDPRSAFDGDPATSWSVALPTPTDVATPAVGLVIDLGRARKLRKMTITTTTPGTTVEVYGSADATPPATLDDDGWKHLATQLDVDAGEKTSITLGDDVTGTGPVRQLMIWFAQGPDDGSASVGISELALFR